MTQVMIVDDEMDMTRLLKMLLELEGFTVSVSPTGGGALEAIAVTPPDVMMVDYHLRDMNGEELIRQLRAQDSFAKTPIVVASGKDVELEVRNAGATEFLLKPFEPDDLIVMLRRLTEQEESAPSSEQAQPTEGTQPSEITPHSSITQISKTIPPAQETQQSTDTQQPEVTELPEFPEESEHLEETQPSKGKGQTGDLSQS